MLQKAPEISDAAPPCIFTAPPADPFFALQEWWSNAVATAVAEPGVMALATADTDGFASNRMVQLLEVQRGQLIFTSHADSQKGREIAATAWASGVLYWREVKRQIIVSGPVAPLGPEESNQRWAERPREINAMSAVSHQSAVLEDEAALRQRALELVQSSVPLTRPDGWLAYGLMPRVLEFWQFSADRLHRRLRYESLRDGWICCRLQP